MAPMRNSPVATSSFTAAFRLPNSRSRARERSARR